MSTRTESTEQARCHYSDGTRVLSTHLAGCDDAGCGGCKPCTARHCVMPGCPARHLGDHEQLVCARCVGRVREDITWILRACGLLPLVALEGGINSLAATYAGPAADREAWGYMHHSVTSGRLCRCRSSRGQQCPATLPPAYGPTCLDCDHTSCARIRGLVCPDVMAWVEDCRDEQHPLWVLGTWDMTIRQHLGQVTILAVTIERAAAYLNGHLTDLAQDPDFAFDQMSTEIHQCRTHIETVLALGEHIERGAPCPACREAGRTHPAALERVNNDADTTGAGDRWKCPRCKTSWTEAEYRLRVTGDYLDHATRLTASQMAKTYRISEGSVRGWASLGKVRKRGRDDHGLTLYDVADTLAMRDKKAQATA